MDNDNKNDQSKEDKDIKTCPKCGGVMRKRDGMWICENCGYKMPIG